MQHAAAPCEHGRAARNLTQRCRLPRLALWRPPLPLIPTVGSMEATTSPVLSTRSGCECVAHVLQTLTELDEDATIVSVDGIGAYDLISRKAMLEGCPKDCSQLNGDNNSSLSSGVFWGAPSTYIWEDEMGTNHRIPQGEGREQGDPLVPLLSSLGQHRALTAVQDHFLEGNGLFAFLDDIYVIRKSERVPGLHNIMEKVFVPLRTHPRPLW